MARSLKDWKSRNKKIIRKRKPPKIEEPKEEIVEEPEEEEELATVEPIVRLTEKQRRFVEAYLGEANGNGTKAASIAGYECEDPSHFRQIAHKNLSNPKIRRAIEERTENDGSVATRKERQAFLSTVMRTEHRKMHERLKAVELLCRMHGDFIEKHKVDMTVGRKEQKQEIVNFLDQLSQRAQVAEIGPGAPIVQVINTDATDPLEAEIEKESK
mgnify:CR=1 FL=1